MDRLIARAEELLKDGELSEEIVKLLRAKLEEGDFGVGTPGGSTHLSVVNLDEDLALWKEGFEAAYDPRRGPGRDVFLGYLEVATRTASCSPYHSPTLAIVQASGCGKSRLIRESATCFPFLYLCCAETNTTSFPPPIADAQLRRFILGGLGTFTRPVEELVAAAEGLLRRMLSLAVVLKRRCPSTTYESLFRTQAFGHDELVMLVEEASADESSFCTLVEHFVDLWRPRHNIVSFIFDEASALFVRGTTLYRAVRRVIQEFMRQQRRQPNSNTLMNAVFLSTESRVSNFSPGAHQDPSARYTLPGTDVDLYAPFTCVCNPTGFFRTACAPTVAETQTAFQLSSLGRPLWHVAFNLQGSGILDFAKKKLCGGLPFEHLVSQKPERVKNVYLAVAITALGLVVYPRRLLAEDLAAYNMIFLELVEEDREVVWVKPVSEPILALAAADILRNRFPDVLNALRAEIDHGLHFRGEVGEIFTRALLVRAAAQARVNSQALIPVRDLLQQLIPEGITQDDFSGWHVGFCHTVSTRSDIDQQLLHTAFRSSAAISAKPCQPCFDLVIPVSTGQIDETLRVEDMIAIFVEVKNRKAKRTKHRPKSWADMLASGVLFGGSCALDRSILLDSMCLLQNMAKSDPVDKFPTSILVVVQLGLSAQTVWRGEIGGHAAFVVNPVGVLPTASQPACLKFCEEVCADATFRLFDRVAEKYNFPEKMRSFASQMISDNTDPLVARAGPDP